MSGIYRALGLLSKGQLVEVDRSELVAGYLGQTATKTADAVASAAGGVLFIDEAYSLTGLGPQGDQYGQEAVDTLVKEMEDRRDDLVVIVAGYPAPMAAFIAANPGLASRFRTTIEFADYTDDELVAILTQLAAGADYELVPEAVERFRETLGRTPRGTASATAGSPATPWRPPSDTTPGDCARSRRPRSTSCGSWWPRTSTRSPGRTCDARDGTGQPATQPEALADSGGAP